MVPLPSAGDGGSGGELVLVDESTEDVPAGHVPAERADRARDRRGELQASVRSGPVVVLDVLVDSLELRAEGAGHGGCPEWRTLATHGPERFRNRGNRASIDVTG